MHIPCCVHTLGFNRESASLEANCLTCRCFPVFLAEHILQFHLHGVHEQAGLVADFTIGDTLSAESGCKSSHFLTPELIGLFTVDLQKSLCATLDISCSAISGKLDKGHGVSEN